MINVSAYRSAVGPLSALYYWRTNPNYNTNPNLSPNPNPTEPN